MVSVKGLDAHHLNAMRGQGPAVRNFKKRDLKDILAIERMCFSEPWSDNMFKALYQMDPKGLFVAEKNEIIVGYAVVLTEQLAPRLMRKGRAHLLNFAVHPKSRNKGVGSLLLREITAQLLERKVNHIFLEVRSSNEKAISFYEKAEFKKTGIVTGFYGDEDALIMEKDIA